MARQKVAILYIYVKCISESSVVAILDIYIAIHINVYIYMYIYVDSAGNNIQSLDIVAPTFENVQPISRNDHT